MQSIYNFSQYRFQKTKISQKVFFKLKKNISSSFLNQNFNLKINLSLWIFQHKNCPVHLKSADSHAGSICFFSKLRFLIFFIFNPKPSLGLFIFASKITKLQIKQFQFHFWCQKKDVSYLQVFFLMWLLKAHFSC